MSYDKYKAGNTGGFEHNYIKAHRVSYAKKKAHNFKWVENMSDYYYQYHTGCNSEEMERLNMNYNLYNGRGQEAMQNMAMAYSNSDLEVEGIDMGFENIQHHDIISSVAKAMVGEQHKRPLSPMAIDSSPRVLNQRKRKRTQMYQAYLQETIIAPQNEELAQRYLQENGITDPYKLSPEQQQQMQADLQQRAKAATPKEIQDFMRNDYKAVSENQAQQLIDYLMRELDVKFLTDENFKHMIISGKQIYRIGVRHNEPFLEICNAKGFSYGSASNSLFIEEGDWAKYTQNIKYADFFAKFGDQVTDKDIKKLNSCVNLGGNGIYRDARDAKLVSVVEVNEGNMEKMNFNIRNKEGQQYMNQLYQNMGGAAMHTDIEHTHVTFKSLRKLKQISRLDKKKNKLEKFWVDESYTFSPMKGDIKETSAWVPEVWECDRFGGGSDGIYLNKQPLPYQYRSLQRPWKVNIPYYGVEMSRLMGNAKNVSPIDLGKPWQYKFNVAMARLHEMEATDIGKVLLTSFNAIPKGWTWGKFFQMMKYGKIAPVDFQAEGMNPMNAQQIRSLDLSNMNDMAGRLQYLEWISNRVALAMSYNPSRLGQVSPYTAVQNNQQNIIQSSHQTEDIFSTHNKVVENVLNALLQAARVAYKDNPKKLTYLLDDMSVAELDLDWEMLWRSELGVFISNSSEDFNNVNQVKQQAQAMIQNGLISFPELIRLQWAKNYGEVINIAEKAEEKMMERQQQQQQQQQQMQQQAEATQQKMLEMEIQLKMIMQDKDLANKREVAAMDSMKFAAQHDIDKNMVNDGIQKERIKIASQEKIAAMANETKRKQIESTEKVKKKEIQAKRLESKKKMNKK